MTVDPDLHHDLQKEFDALEAQATSGTEKIGKLIDLTYLAKQLENRVGDFRKKLDDRIKQALLDNDMKGAQGITRKVSLADRTFWGVAEGQNEKEQEANAAKCLKFVDTYGPKQVKATTAQIKKAVDAYLDENPGNEVPAYIAKHSDPVLRNLKN